MERKKMIVLISVLAAGMICLGVFLVYELMAHPFRHWLDDLVYDNYNHYMPCEDLHTIGEVNEAVQANRSILEQVDQLAPGIVGWQVEEPCPGKGDILFWYGSHDQRNQVEALIGSEESFFGIPIRMRNE
jgi:hypothetical protein